MSTESHIGGAVASVDAQHAAELAAAFLSGKTEGKAEEKMETLFRMVKDIDTKVTAVQNTQDAQSVQIGVMRAEMDPIKRLMWAVILAVTALVCGALWNLLLQMHPGK